MRTISPLKTFVVTLSAVLILSACGQQKPELKASTAQPIMATKIKVDKSTPIVMYINTNNVHIYDLDQAQMQEGVTTNTPFLEQFMKYDKVKLYNTQGDWAYVEGEARDTRTSVVRPVGGWVSKDTLNEWQPEQFFAVKDNVFKKITQPITIYNDSLEGQAVDKIATGDTLRVLKGNGERFFVVSKKGKEGWIEAESVDSSLLVAKGFGFRESDFYEVEVSSNYKITNRYGIKEVNYEISPEDVLFNIGKNNEINLDFLIGRDYSKGNKGNKYIQVNGNEIDLQSRIGEMWHSPLNLFDITNINGKGYHSGRTVIENFFGMIAVIDVYISTNYGFKLNQFESEIEGFESMKSVKYWAKKQENSSDFEIVNITLYTRDVNLNKIKSFTFQGKYAMLESVKYLHKAINKIELTDDGIKIKFGTLSYYGLLDPVPDFDKYLFSQIYDNALNQNLSSIEVKEFFLSNEELSVNRLDKKQIVKMWNLYRIIKKQSFENKNIVPEIVTFINKNYDNFKFGHKKYINLGKINHSIGVLIPDNYLYKFNNQNVILAVGKYKNSEQKPKTGQILFLFDKNIKIIFMSDIFNSILMQNIYSFQDNILLFSAHGFFRKSGVNYEY